MYNYTMKTFQKARFVNCDMFQIVRSTLDEDLILPVLDSIVVSIPACHAGDQGSIPCRGALFNKNMKMQRMEALLVQKTAPRQGIEPWSPA